MICGCWTKKIVDKGIHLETDLVKNAIKCDTQFQQSKKAEAIKLTGVDNPNSVKQLKDWLEERGIEVESLSKDAVKKKL